MYPYNFNNEEKLEEQVEINQRPPFGEPDTEYPFEEDFPRGLPPSYVPNLGGPTLRAVDPNSMRGCMRKFTYVSLENGSSFWFYPTFVGRRSVSGYRWSRRRNQWIYTGIDLRDVRRFSCS